MTVATRNTHDVLSASLVYVLPRDGLRGSRAASGLAVARCLWASLALLEQAVAREKVAAMKMAVARENRAETMEMVVTKAEPTMEMAGRDDDGD
jgi:hypothetical protein